MRVHFYVFGITDLQDMFPYIREAIDNSKYDCQVIFFDCFSSKRQFYYYTDEELLTLFGKSFSKVYRKNQQKEFQKEYTSNPADIIFTKNIKPKQAFWFPKMNLSKVVYFNYMIETHHLENSFVKVAATLINKEKWRPLYTKYKTIEVDDYRMENLKYVKKENYKKRCFIVESWMREKLMKSKLIQSEALFYNSLISDLKKAGYEIVWKCREKGFPKASKWGSPLDYIKEKPDIVIEKDSNLPSALYYYAFNSDICLFVNDCFAFFDTININPNSYIIKSPFYEERKYKFEEGWFNEFKENILTYEEFWDKEAKIVKKSKLTNYNTVEKEFLKIIELVMS